MLNADLAGTDTDCLLSMKSTNKLNLQNKIDYHKIGIKQYNDHWRDIVMRYSGQWEAIVKRFGRWIDFENDYKTMDLQYMESVWY